MKKRVTDFCKCWFVLMAVMGVDCAVASQATNARVATPATNVAPARADGRGVTRGVMSDTGATKVVSSSRSATRRPTAVRSRAAASGNNGVVTGRNAIRKNIISSTPIRSSAAAASRAASANVVRGAVAKNSVSAARSAKMSNVSRAATSRATAVFTDISKIGGGYATCRDAYATCMDQFCANANDTYRRCFCSARFTEFRNAEAALDEAKALLANFENNNLTAVTMSAAEVNAMYTATAGEQAIKNDTSAAAAMLAEVGDLLSGKKKASKESTSAALGLTSVDFSTDMDDIWGGGSSLFASDDESSDLSALEGQALFKQSNDQCLALISDSCENDAVLDMARSAYNIMITQDCNLYEKKVNSQKEAVQQTVRTAEKYLREARLEEYRAHNSADVNECLNKVRTAILSDVACGPNYERCLDNTGVFINQSTGEPIYSQRLFQLADLITLDGAAGGDVLTQNPEFSSFLETRRMFAESALDTCRDISATVWEEFKRTALIEISQAQDEKLEEIKMSCVSTMKGCYNTQTKALNDFDETTAKAAGALSAYAAKAMCQEKVIACASLYGDTDGCNFDGNGKLSGRDDGTCGLQALLSFVDTVDEVRVAEGCGTAIDNYLKQLCTPDTGDRGYPWKCRNYQFMNGGYDNKGIFKETATDWANYNTGNAANTLTGMVVKYAIDNCANPSSTGNGWGKLELETQNQVRQAVDSLREELDYQLADACETLDGYWQSTGSDISRGEGTDLNAFYSTVFGGRNQGTQKSLGVCVENTTMIRCLSYNESDAEPVAKYDVARDECTFTDEWYKNRCESIGGYYEKATCYLPNEQPAGN